MRGTKKAKKITLIVGVLIVTTMLFTACSKVDPSIDAAAEETFATWEEVLRGGADKTVTIFMWGGNESINQYMDGYVSEALKANYGITLRRVPMNPPEYLSKLLNDKRGNNSKGTADLLWINGENFRTAKDAGLIWGPFTDLLPNLNRYYEQDASDLNIDTGIPIEGYEAIWGRAQLVFTYDSKLVPDPPRNFEELLHWARENPGRFTYPKLPDDFAGSAFIRTAFYELTGERDVFQTELTKEEFDEIAKPVVDYFKELNKYSWRQGKAYPAGQAQLDELFKNGEVSFTMGFEVGKTSGMVLKGIYPETVRTYVFDTGTIGNSHYLAIPYNAPNKAAALIAIDFLESPEAQIEKYKPEVWGDVPAFDLKKVDVSVKEKLEDIQGGEASMDMELLFQKRLPEMQVQYIDWIETLWIEKIAGK